MATSHKKSLVNRKWRPIYCKRLLEFFSREPEEPITFKDDDGNVHALTDKKGNPVFRINPPPTFEAFAISIMVNPSTLRAWKNTYPDFAEAYEMAKAMQKESINRGAMLGHFDRVYAIFLAKNVTDMRDRNETVNVDMSADDWVRQMADEDEQEGAD